MLHNTSRAGLRRTILAVVVMAVLGAACGQAPTPPSSPYVASQPPLSAPPSAALATAPVIIDVPFYKADSARSGVHPGPGPIAQPVELWRAELDCAIGDRTGVIGSGLFVVGCDANRLVAIEAQTGSVRWATDLDGPIHGSPAIADGAVYVSDSAGSFRKLELASGTTEWSVQIRAMRQPVVVDGTVYVGTEDGRFLGLDPADGSERWSWQAPGGAGQVSGTVVDDVAFVAADDGNLYAVSLADGSNVWKFAVISGRVSTPAISDDSVFVAALEAGARPSGELYALDRATGEERWRYRTESGRQIAPPTIADGVVYSPSSDQGLFAFDAAEGSVRWRAETGTMSGQTPAITSDAVYLATDRSVAAFARTDGTMLWEIDLNADIDNSPVVSGGMVIVGDNAGIVRAFGEEWLAALLPGSSATSSPGPTAGVRAQLELVATLDARSSELDQPSGMDLGPDGKLYVVNALASEILVLEPEGGTILRRWGSKGSDPGQFDFVRDVAESESAIGGVAVAADGTVYVADTVNRRVQKFDSKGTPLGQWGRFGEENGQFLEPIDIDVGPEGRVYVVDDQRDDIQVFTRDGEFINTIGEHGTGDGQLNFTSGIFVGPDGTVYNADWDNHRVQAWDADGTFLWTIGTRGSGPGQFTHPADVIADSSGRIHVTDQGRIQTFTSDGMLIGVLPTGLDAFLMAAGDGVAFVSAQSDDQIHVYRILD